MSEVFMCWAEGTLRPKRRHESLEIAMGEAQRLSELPDVKGRVFVMADIAVIEKPAPAGPVVTVKKKRLIILPE